MLEVQRVSVSSYFVLIGYRHYSELGCLVLNTCILMGLFTLSEFANSSLCDVNTPIGINVFKTI